jgi:uncharacterized protein (DUF885 family)
VKVRLLIAVMALAACGPAGTGERDPLPETRRQPGEADIIRATNDFHKVRDAFLAGYYEARPVRATELGIHRYDARLPALGRPGVQQYVEGLLDWLAQLERIPPRILEDEDRLDYAVMEFALRAELLEWEEIRGWAHDPRVYTGTIARGIASVAERPFAPLRERILALRSRMDAAPAVLVAARENLSSPPALWTELAIEETRGLVAFLEHDLAPMLASQGGIVDAPLPTDLVESRDQLTAALRDHLAWLGAELLPASNGNFRLGRYLFERKLLLEEHIILNATDLDQLNESEIQRYQEQVARVAAEIDPARTPREVMDSLTRIHPEPGELIATAREMMEDVRAWVARTGVVPLPDEEVPVVRETPPYARGGFASLDAPGPFETGSLAAYYNITNVRPEWTEEQKRQHLTYFNGPGLLGVTIHETFPGHYVQLAYEREVPSELRQVFTPLSFVEGWAHYAEQMVLDEGYAAGDPAIRLGQLRRALQRHARWYAGLHLHAFAAPIEDVVERFMEIAYFEEFPARREVERATYDPTYLYYALGRMQIVLLRGDYQERIEKEGGTFSLPDFHDMLLRLALPLPLAREVMIPTTERRPTGAARRR